MSKTHPTDDTFELFDLRVEVICPPGERILCGAKEGDHFTLEGEMLHLPPGQGFSIYSLGAILPLLAAKQRVTHPNDWMSTDADVACPDPNCKSLLRITRTGKQSFSHGAVTVVPLQAVGKSPQDHLVRKMFLCVFRLTTRRWVGQVNVDFMVPR